MALKALCCDAVRYACRMQTDILHAKKRRRGRLNLIKQIVLLIISSPQASKGLVYAAAFDPSLRFDGLRQWAMAPSPCRGRSSCHILLKVLWFQSSMQPPCVPQSMMASHAQ